MSHPSAAQSHAAPATTAQALPPLPDARFFPVLATAVPVCARTSSLTHPVIRAVCDPVLAALGRYGHPDWRTGQTRIRETVAQRRAAGVPAGAAWDHIESQAARALTAAEAAPGKALPGADTPGTPSKPEKPAAQASAGVPDPTQSPEAALHQGLGFLRRGDPSTIRVLEHSVAGDLLFTQWATRIDQLLSDQTDAGRTNGRTLEALMRSMAPEDAEALEALVAYGTKPLSHEIAMLWLMTGADPTLAQDMFPAMATVWQGLRSTTLLSVSRDTTTDPTKDDGVVVLRVTIGTAQQPAPLTLLTHWWHVPGAFGGWRLTRIDGGQLLLTWLSGAPFPPHEDRR